MSSRGKEGKSDSVDIGPIRGLPLLLAIGLVMGAVVGIVVGGLGGYYLYLRGVFDREIDNRVQATRAAQPTVAPLPTYTPMPTSTSYPTYTPYPTATPILYVVIDPMETVTDWIQYKDSKGSTMVIGLVEGKTNKAVQISYALEEYGYLGITKHLIPCQLFGTRGIRFFYRGSGKPNSVELKLIYTPDEQGREAIFSVVRNHATDTNGHWGPFETLYSEFKCWPDTGCSADALLDVSKVYKIDFAISNKQDPQKPEQDAPGPGVILIDDVQAFK